MDLLNIFLEYHLMLMDKLKYMEDLVLLIKM